MNLNKGRNSGNNVDFEALKRAQQAKIKAIKQQHIVKK